MQTVYWILIFLGTFFFMEFMAWFTHKYIMHGFLWSLHKDHHHKDHGSWWERNDLFFVFYALVSIGCFLLWRYEDVWFTLPIGLGILAYGIAYFTVHDIFIHQRFKMFRNANNWYARGIRRAHKMHHKHLGKDHGENFGMLIVPFKYFKK
ncbi:MULTISPECIES: sterol desaturase family protein [Mesonia]|uniref:Beta-carotene hydroxylase n=1 Tax=Mesonia mobilis TaxID=369791 RepID=A0ABQ3BP64_9FLAO|nr:MULTISPECIES: sterol desaturase family protein [Mesonia]GGZ52539.1 beta-carotene hydroxylase [Mesonia mobilis]HIB36721.1 beta-carotene hydroxylase [Mesonia sp.]HIO27580.1 beta-carotene hydroxylase [Flavobacteriaceae bacterium]|tara:strand:+ start:579 stop:1028 length:450 start_codon:yes stop_codon:yes gene_type:complete